MKLKELKECREKLRKCDELEKWVEILTHENTEMYASYDFTTLGGLHFCKTPVIPLHIREIFVAALKAEIEKLDNE